MDRIPKEDPCFEKLDSYVEREQKAMPRSCCLREIKIQW
jgi:hypothetical protein